MPATQNGKLCSLLMLLISPLHLLLDHSAEIWPPKPSPPSTFSRPTSSSSSSPPPQSISKESLSLPFPRSAWKRQLLLDETVKAFMTRRPPSRWVWTWTPPLPLMEVSGGGKLLSARRLTLLIAFAGGGLCGCGLWPRPTSVVRWGNSSMPLPVSLPKLSVHISKLFVLRRKELEEGWTYGLSAAAARVVLVSKILWGDGRDKRGLGGMSWCIKTRGSSKRGSKHDCKPWERDGGDILCFLEISIVGIGIGIGVVCVFDWII